MKDICEEAIVQARATIEYPVYQEGQNTTCNMWSWIILFRLRLAGLGDRVQLLDVRCQKCTNLRSNHRWSELEMSVSCIQSPCKPSHQVQGPHSDIECKRVLFLDSMHVYGHQNTASRTGTRLKRRHCVTPLFCCVIRRITPVTVSLYAALSKEATVMVSVLKVHTAANVVTMYERILFALQNAHFLINSPWCGCMVLQGRLQNMSKDVSYGKGFISCMPFSVWFSETHWLYIRMTEIGIWPVRRTITRYENLHSW